MATKATKKTDSLKAQIRAELEKAGAQGVKVRAIIKKYGKRAPARVFDLRVTDGVNVVTEPSRGPDCVYVIKKRKPTPPSPKAVAKKVVKKPAKKTKSASPPKKKGAKKR